MKCVYERKVYGNNFLTRPILSIYNLSVETIPLFILISAVQKNKTKKNQKYSQAVVVRTLHQQVALSWSIIRWNKTTLFERMTAQFVPN